MRKCEMWRYVCVWLWFLFPSQRPFQSSIRALQVFSVKEQGGSQAEGLCNGNFLLKATGVVR